MAKVTMKMPEDFLLKVSRLNDKTDEIIPRVLKAGGEVVLEVAHGLLLRWGSAECARRRCTGA